MVLIPIKIVKMGFYIKNHNFGPKKFRTLGKTSICSEYNQFI